MPGIGLLYENRFAAKESYAVLRSWNFGRFIDEHRNIHVSFVREGGSRYSFFIYPGVRIAGHMAVEDCAKNEFPNTDVDAEVFRVLLWTATPIDCSENPKKEELIESLTKEPVLIL